MADRFFTPQPLGVGEITLDGPEAHHLAAVRRFGTGDQVTLFNGDGREYSAEVVSVGKRAAVLQVVSGADADRELGFDLVIGSAVPKGDRADYLIEKLTELGATRFVPLSSARSVVRPGEAKSGKFARAVIEASKQCGRNRLMAVDRPQHLTEFLNRPDLPTLRLVLHTAPGAIPSERLGADDVRGGLAVAVGPEGGFTVEEVADAVRAGWRPVCWGRRVLRVETAAVAVAAWAARFGQ